MSYQTNKRKIINDPVFGFVTIKSDLIFDLIQHPYFQRLRRIKQLGLSNMVFPGVNHTRFEHAIGALHLMHLAIDVLQQKGVEITEEEAEAVSATILLHDIGHGPFSHALEFTLVKEVNHEELSLLFMRKINEEFNNKLELAIEIFTNNYSKKFLHQLVSSQLDMDRLDYLRRDSFYSGVTEGIIGSDRIIKMLNVINDELVIEYKGIYSIEKFLIARRLMYWQVYLHKTVLVAEHLIIKILQRARELSSAGIELFASPSLKCFLMSDITFDDFQRTDSLNEITALHWFAQLDDADIISAIKVWQGNSDRILSKLSRSLIERKLFRIEISDKRFNASTVIKMKQKISRCFKVNAEEADYFIINDSIINNAYSITDDKITILLKDGSTADIRDASDIDLEGLTKTVRKHFLCYPKELEINEFCI